MRPPVMREPGWRTVLAGMLLALLLLVSFGSMFGLAFAFADVLVLRWL